MMPPIHNLRLRPHKGLKQATLGDLGKINVLCGPNNSGKTTALECIEVENRHALGRAMDSEFSHRIEENIMRGGQWREQNLKEGFIAALAEGISAQSVWFADEREDLFGRVLTIWQRQFGTRVGMVDRNAFLTAIAAEFPTPKVVMIPAKRRLETSKIVAAFEPIRADGTGVLNFLFSSKNQEATSLNRKQFDAIHRSFSEISAGSEFDVYIHTKPQGRTPPDTIIELRFRRENGAWVDAVDCGLGLHELLIILYYSLAAEHEVVLIEEPENHLHPDIQRRLVRFLQANTQKQFFLSTHSSVFLNTEFVDRIFSCRMTQEVEITNATSRAALLSELGYSIADNLVSDLIVLCEGPKDKLFLEEFFQKYTLSDRYNIKIWPLGGDTMDQLDLSVFNETHRLIALIDRDPQSGRVRKRFIEKCNELKIPVTMLERYALENYFSMNAIRSVMHKPIPADLEEFDPKRRVSDQLGFEVKKNSKAIAREMQATDIAGTDLERFFMDVEALLKQG
jgi:hypothetical protein